jgi:NlpC/P60 family putative phage cell wall peptidase
MSALDRTLIVARARAWIGTPYLHQASVRGVACDCLGLVRGVWREVIGAEPEVAGPYSPDWAEASREERLAKAGARHFDVVDVSRFRPGDVLLFRWRTDTPAKHLAIATTADAMVHAHDGACVCEVAISSWWRRRLAYAFAFPGAH